MKRITITLLVLFAALTAASAQQPQPAPPDRFVDVPTDHWAYQAVENLRKLGIIVGYPDHQLRGKRTVTRYEAATGLNRFIAAARGQKRTTAAPGSQGQPGPQGPRGVQGPAGPAGERSKEVDLYRDLMTRYRGEVANLKRELAAAEQKTGQVERELKK